MKKMMHRGLCLLLILTLALSVAACGQNSTPETTTVPGTQDTTAAPDTTATQAEVENAVTYFSMTYGETYERMHSLNAADNGDGTTHVEYVGEEKKVGNLEGDVLGGITTALSAAGLAELNGKEVYEEGEATASMYIEFADGTSLTASFSGTVPQEYISGYETMDTYFKTLVADLPVYVPQAQVMGEVNADALAAMQEILNNSGIQRLDVLTISDVPMDDYFGFTMGLSSSEGIINGTSCVPMMTTEPYSLVIATVEDETNIDSVAADFESSLDWQKWVCVNPSNALIAQKGSMVLCLVGEGDMYTQTAASIAAAGWSEIKALENPNMQ